jgi:uncharacterized membrane protein YkoI
MLTALLIGAMISASGQKATDVPAPAKAAFEKAHPNAQHVKWSRENKDYEAEFDQDGQEMSVVVNAAGNILETEQQIAANFLPNPIHDYVLKNLPGKKIKGGSKITMADGTVKYEAELEGGGDDLLFDHNGLYLGKEADDDKGDKEDDDDKD